jgi:hypothetical protein
MVRALRFGVKTQTRRLATSPLSMCQPGDALYVRETYGIEPSGFGPVRVIYAAGGDRDLDFTGDAKWIEQADRLWTEPEHWRPSIHMPRWASRLTLTVVAVRIERLQAISSSDALEEGVVLESADPPFYYVPGVFPHSITAIGIEEPDVRVPHPVRCYAKLWEHLHGAGSWAANPKVLVLTFRVGHFNIDGVGA